MVLHNGADTQITPFDFHGHQVRVLGTEAEPLFILKDLCDAVGISNIGNVVQRLDGADIRRMDVWVESAGRNYNMALVTEAGMYEVILRSDKPEAVTFKRWVTREVLPSIRKRGGYLTPEATEAALTDPDFIIRLATELKTERAKTAELTARAEADRPKVLFAEAVSTSKSHILVGDLAKILRGNGIHVGGTRLFAWLRENGFLINRKGTDWNMPTQKAMELGLFKVKETTVVHSDGHTSLSKTSKVTGRGQEYFISRFMDGRFKIQEVA